MDKLSPTSWWIRAAFPFRKRWELPSFISKCQLFWHIVGNLVPVLAFVGLTIICYLRFSIFVDVLEFLALVFGLTAAILLVLGGIVNLLAFIADNLPECKRYIVEEPEENETDGN